MRKLLVGSPIRSGQGGTCSKLPAHPQDHDQAGWKERGSRPHRCPDAPGPAHAVAPAGDPPRSRQSRSHPIACHDDQLPPRTNLALKQASPPAAGTPRAASTGLRPLRRPPRSSTTSAAPAPGAPCSCGTIGALVTASSLVWGLAEVYPKRANDPAGSFTLAELETLDWGAWFNTARPDRAWEESLGSRLQTLEVDGFLTDRPDLVLKLFGRPPRAAAAQALAGILAAGKAGRDLKRRRDGGAGRGGEGGAPAR